MAYPSLTSSHHSDRFSPSACQTVPEGVRTATETAGADKNHLENIEETPPPFSWTPEG